MPGNSASLTFKLFGIDVNASRTISGVGVAAAGTARDLQVLSTSTLKFVGAAGAAGIASVGLAGALGVGLGGAFAAVGVAAALASKTVRKEFKTLGEELKKQISAAAKPVQDAMLQLVKYISASIKTMAPLLHSFFTAVAPLVTIIGHGLVQAVANLVGEFTPLVKVVTPIVNELFAQLPDLIGNLAAGLKAILSPLTGNTKAFGTLLQTIGTLLPIVGSIIGSLVQLGQQIMPAFQRAIFAVGTALDSGLAKVLPLVGKAINQMLPPVAALIGALLRAAAQVLPLLLPVLSKVVVTLADAASKVLPQILPALLSIVQAFARLLPAVTPLIPPILYLARSVTNLIPPLADLAGKFLASLMPALEQILPLLVQVGGQIGTALAKALRDAAPSLVQVARAAGQILAALTPLIPVVVKAALSFTPLIPAVAKIASILAQGLVPIVETLVPLLIPLAPTLVKIAIAAKLWTIAQGLLNVVLAANPIGLVIIAVAALAAGLVYAWKHSETFRDVVLGVFNAVRTFIRVTVDGIITIIRGWFNAQAQVVIGIIALFARLPGPMGAPFRALKGVAERARDNVNNALDGIKRTVDVTFQGHDKVNAVIKQINAEMKASGYSVTARLVHGGAFAKGGRLSGYGGGDILPIWAEPGEAIVPKEQARRPEFMAWARAMGIPGFARGGRVGWPADVNLEASKDALLARLAGGTTIGSGGITAVAARVLAVLGRGLGELGALVRRIMFESGGNPNAVNRSDSNWIAGHPSVGLMQVIRGTFNAWAGPYRGIGPFLYGVSVAPFPNVYAGANYAVGRYGSIYAVDPLVRPIGYDRGGWLPPGLSMAWNGTGRPERVGGGTVINVTINGAVGSKTEIIRWVRAGIRADMRREGHNPGGI